MYIHATTGFIRGRMIIGAKFIHLISSLRKEEFSAKLHAVFVSIRFQETVMFRNVGLQASNRNKPVKTFSKQLHAIKKEVEKKVLAAMLTYRNEQRRSLFSTDFNGATQ